MNQNPPLTLYTIGHSDRSIEEFISHLKQFGITVLVDVRSAPYSRRISHFNKNELRANLYENGIRYSYAGEKLGGRPKDTDVYYEQPGNTTKREDYLKSVNYEAVMRQPWYQEAIVRLLDIVTDAAQDNESVVIMCSEGDPRQCHRHHLIARSLITEDAHLRATDQQVSVRHILRDGTLESTLDALTEFPIVPQQQKLF